MTVKCAKFEFEVGFAVRQHREVILRQKRLNLCNVKHDEFVELDQCL